MSIVSRSLCIYMQYKVPYFKSCQQMNYNHLSIFQFDHRPQTKIIFNKNQCQLIKNHQKKPSKKNYNLTPNPPNQTAKLDPNSIYLNLISYNRLPQLIVLYLMNADQCIQFIHSTTNSQGLIDYTEFFKFDGDDDPYFALQNGSINDVDEQSQPQNSKIHQKINSQGLIDLTCFQFDCNDDPYFALENCSINNIDEQSQAQNSQRVDFPSEQWNSQGILIAQHYCQQQDSLNNLLSQERPNIQQVQRVEQGQRQQMVGQDEVNPSIRQNLKQETQQKQQDIQNSKNKRFSEQVLGVSGKIQDKKHIKKQANLIKAKRIRKRMRQQMKGLGQNTYYKFKKNVNMPKAIGRYLIAFHNQFKNTHFKNYVNEFINLSEKLKEKSEWIKESKKNSFKLQHLKQFFSNEVGTRSSKLNRLLMRKIIQSHKREQIIENNQVKDKLEYLVSSKIFSLRCSNPSLACRMQMR